MVPETQELRQIIMDYIRKLQERINKPEQVQLLHEMLETYKTFTKI